YDNNGRYVLTPGTMPLKITEAANVFTIAPETWTEQQVGTAEAANNVGFASKQIRDLAFFRNRLVFAHSGGFSASESGDPTNFFRDTMLLTLDTDPIHVKALQGADNGLHWVVPFGETLVLFGDDNQFAMPVT